jgi:hypothetical protein
MARPYYVYGGNLLNREKYTSVVNTAYGDRRYFSSIDTDVYFGDILIDEMVAFDFMLEEKKIPIFGYNNFTPKRLITGQKSIQGSFAINFTQAFSLKAIIDSLPESLYANDYEEAQFFCADDNKAIFGKGFDITISYGEAKDEGSYNACTQMLVGCHITSYQQAFDTSGEPILDMYTFIAQDLIIQQAQPMEVSIDVIETTSNTEYSKEPKGSEPYKIANIMHKKERTDVQNYCDSNVDTVGILIDPTFDCINGKFRISLNIESYKARDCTIEEVSITLDDSLIGGSYNFTLDKSINMKNIYHEMTGTNVNIAKKILKLFQDGKVDYLECAIHIKGNNDMQDTSFATDIKGQRTTIRLGGVQQ